MKHINVILLIIIIIFFGLIIWVETASAAIVKPLNLFTSTEINTGTEIKAPSVSVTQAEITPSTEIKASTEISPLEIRLQKIEARLSKLESKKICK